MAGIELRKKALGEIQPRMSEYLTGTISPNSNLEIAFIIQHVRADAGMAEPATVSPGMEQSDAL
jgi:hypothetical protein